MRIHIATIAIAGLALAGAARAEGPDFEKEIWPFVKNSCVKCHQPPHKDERGRTRKPKADLVITNKADFLKGGEDGEVIKAGNPKESSFLQRTLLDMSSDDHMPPEGKADEWTDEQKKLFEAWIQAGADFGKWERDPEVDLKDE
ncbi:MAG: hypothetical protein KDM91_12480 [Verrucomicrobiae bacterium]|nr:hypothetical protein [Verrucomicrobiae bacterium]MCP5541290.1 hypothetical protein [Akkermansiaceae bacterium]MCP5550955.1 hypothetical protein [Akkermansiaceae bacterium]